VSRCPAYPAEAAPRGEPSAVRPNLGDRVEKSRIRTLRTGNGLQTLAERALTWANIRVMRDFGTYWA
jgi:hypothetical protein